jgi:cytidylate kinase
MFKVAIDGPSGAGKSTIAKTVARTLGFVYIDTGAMYRTAALACLNQNTDIKLNPEKAVEIVNNISIDIDYIDGEQRIFLNGEDVSGRIRTPEVSMGASDISAIGKVREKLVAMQRVLAGTKNVIMDGRDIGTHVLPDADVKIFLTASAEVRAQRRYKELIEKGTLIALDEYVESVGEFFSEMYGENLDTLFHDGVVMAGTVISIAPPIIAYLFLQKRFIEGIEPSGLTGM